MDNKGTNTVNMLVAIIVSLAFFAVVVAIFFGPESLYMGLQNIIPDPIDYLPIGTSSGDYGASIEKRDAVSIFDEFATAYNNLAKSGADQCFLIFPQEQLKHLFEEHYIEIVKDGPDTRIFLDNRVGGTRGQPDAMKYSPSTNIKIENVTPCTVSEAAATQFRDYWLDEKRLPTGLAGTRGVNPVTNKIELLPGYQMIVDGASAPSFKSDGKTFVLYKAGSNICIFPLASWKGFGCDVKTKDGMQVLDNDCLNEGRKDSLQRLAQDRGYPLYSQGQCSAWNP